MTKSDKGWKALFLSFQTKSIRSTKGIEFNKSLNKTNRNVPIWWVSSNNTISVVWASEGQIQGEQILIREDRIG